MDKMEQRDPFAHLPKRRKTMQDLPKRPNSMSKEELFERDHNAFMMDFENSCLADWTFFPRGRLAFWVNEFNMWDKDFPKGNRRHLDKEWAAFMQKQVYPHHSDVDFSEYCLWVEGGGGDFYFQVNDHDLEVDSSK
jgi:hypothetical protein